MCVSVTPRYDFYSASLDWATLAVLVPASELPHLNDLLISIPLSQVRFSIVSIGV